MIEKTELSRRSFLAAAALAGAAAPLVAQETGGRKVKIGIVGGNFGSGFQWHLDPNCTVAAVCDIQPRALARLAEVYRCKTTYKNFRDVLKDRNIEAVGVFTPAPLHVWMATEAIVPCHGIP